MPKKCPICGNYSLDYDPVLKVWKCVWLKCSYKEDKKKNEENSLLHSILGSSPSYNKNE